MENIGSGDTLAPILARIDQTICSPINLPGGEQVSISVSIGVSTCHGTEEATLESLLSELIAICMQLNQAKPPLTIATARRVLNASQTGSCAS